MIVNGLNADIHMPVAPKGEGTHGLPPHHLQTPYIVDEYPACPANWMHGSDIASSYFVPLEAGRHMWLDFNQCAWHSHEVAAVISVQGINPITGQQTKELRLEQYRTNCPVHDQPFKQNRFCEACNYAWPAQNYMTTTSTPRGHFWIDGFRAADGTVRGFLVTEEAVRGVASQLIGEERVFAIGIAFYLSKNPKPPKPAQNVNTFIGGGVGSPKKRYLSKSKTHHYVAPTQWVDGDGGGYVGNVSMDFGPPLIGSSGGGVWAASNTLGGAGGSSATSSNAKGASRGILRTASLNAASPDCETHQCFAGGELDSDMAFAGMPTNTVSIEPTKLEIGAGAIITQELAHIDNNELSFYADKPAGFIYINYCTTADFQKIIAAGKRDMSKSFMAGLVVGN